MEDAACVHAIDSEMFFSEKDPRWVTAARRTCVSCPVMEKCLKFAYDNHEQTGIWGGLTGQERKQYQDDVFNTSFERDALLKIIHKRQR